MPPDSSAIDVAIMDRLHDDPVLHALLPDGVFFDEAIGGAQRFVVVTLFDHDDRAMFGGRAIEDALYMVKAVSKSGAAVNMRAAALQIDALLEDHPLAAEGFGFMSLHREQRIRRTEVDAVDRSIRWFHRGGYYRVRMTT